MTAANILYINEIGVNMVYWYIVFSNKLFIKTISIINIKL